MRVLVLVATAALALAGAAGAAKPVIFTEEIDDFLPGAVDCGTVALDVAVQGAVTVHEFADGDTIANFRLRITWTNPVTGASLWSPSVGPDITRLNPDGSATIDVVGIIVRVVVPGQGLVAAQIGSVTFSFDSPTDTEPDVTFAGPHDTDEEIDAAVCAALA